MRIPCHSTFRASNEQGTGSRKPADLPGVRPGVADSEASPLHALRHRRPDAVRAAAGRLARRGALRRVEEVMP
jgi:hypothetical protein